MPRRKKDLTPIAECATVKEDRVEPVQKEETMSETQNETTAPAGPVVTVTRSVFDLDSFEEIALVKSVPFTPLASVDAVLEMAGNDGARLLQLVNDGLRSEVRETARKSAEGWHTYDDEGAVNGEFTGTPANMKAVNALVLNLAKSVFGFSKDLSKDQKRAAKDSAREFIRGNNQIREGLKKTAALDQEESDEA